MTLSAVADRDERGIAPWGPFVDKNIPTERDGRPHARQGWGGGCLPCTPAPCSGHSRSWPHTLLSCGKALSPLGHDHLLRDPGLPLYEELCSQARTQLA